MYANIQAVILTFGATFQGSPWRDNISLAILNFHESGVMEDLETTWIDASSCDEESTSPATLGLNHMLGKEEGKEG